jgi:hypothetical protein
MLLCTLLTFAMCADPNISGAVTVGDLTVPIVWSRVRLRSCLDVGQGSTTDGSGFTRLETAWSSQEAPETSTGYAGRVTVRINFARIEMSAFYWDHMTAADVEGLHRLYRAALWHELGHVQTARASVAEANAHSAFTAPTAAEYSATAVAIGNAALARFGAAQEEYDRVAEHGLRQDTLPPPLGGANTIITCTSRR